MWPEDDPEKTELEWAIDFAKGDAAVHRNSRGTILPERDGTDNAKRNAVRVLQRWFVEGASPAGNRLEVSETIGTGGVGVVRQARQVALGRDVAVKMLHPHKRTHEASLDLLHEAWITGSLEHPNIVPVHDILMDEDRSPLVLLKRIEGVVWSELIRDRKRVRELFGAEDLLAWNLGILSQVLNAVRFAHSRGVVHRDLKPENVMVGEFGEVYLLDWGLAVSLRDDETGRLPLAQNATTLAGTPAYMAPEMLGDSEVPITERTDIYLIGSILHEILTGRPPHMGRDAMAIIGSVVQSSPSFSDDVPHGLARICRRAMDPDPHGRFENAEQVRLAIQGFLQHRGSEQLATQAEATRRELEAELGSDDSSEPENRQRLYRLFGACRFGFREALSTWHGNQSARRGLARAITAMIEYELAQGDPRAAAALCAELHEPPPALTERIDRAVARLAASRRRAAELEHLGRQLDIRTGQRVRAIATLVLGLAFTIGPTLISRIWPELAYDSHRNIIGWATAWALVTVVVGVAIRRSLRESAANRRLFSLLVLLIAVSFPLQLGLWRAGFTPDESMVVHVFLWFFLAAILALTFDARLWPAAAGYLATFIVMALVPEWRLYIFNAPHALLTINYVLAWRAA